MPDGARVQATATEGLGPRKRHASPLWTLQRLRFEPDVAADPSDRGENRDPGTGTEAIKIQLTEEARLENGPPSQGVLQCFDQIACAHMSGLFVRSHICGHRVIAAAGRLADSAALRAVARWLSPSEAVR